MALAHDQRAKVKILSRHLTPRNSMRKASSPGVSSMHPKSYRRKSEFRLLCRWGEAVRH
jgi:hypothetical protein